jgi:hypothetical protein
VLETQTVAGCEQLADLARIGFHLAASDGVATAL